MCDNNHIYQIWIFRGINVPKMATQEIVGPGGPADVGQYQQSNLIPASPGRLCPSTQEQDLQQQMHPLLDKSTLKVHLPNGTFNVVRFGDAADIKGIIQLLTNRLYTSGECRYYQHLYAMRMVNINSGDVHWLHQDTTMFQVSSYWCYLCPVYIFIIHQLFSKSHKTLKNELCIKVQEKNVQLQKQNTSSQESTVRESSTNSTSGDWRFELRVRYLPTDLTDLYDRDKITFSCYYDQVIFQWTYYLTLWIRNASFLFAFYMFIMLNTGAVRLLAEKIRIRTWFWYSSSIVLSWNKKNVSRYASNCTW